MSDFGEQASPAHDLARSRRMLTVEDVDLIGAVMARIPDDEYAIVIDLGAGSGTTALAAFCARPERIRVFSFDNDPQMLNWTEEAVKNAGFRDQWRRFEIDAHKGASYWTGVRRRLDGGWTGVDVLLHDAGHANGDVGRDIRAWAPKLVPGAGIWVHDYAAAPDDWGMESYPGVKDDIDGLIDEGMLKPGEISGLGWSGVYAGRSYRLSRRERRAMKRARQKEKA